MRAGRDQQPLSYDVRLPDVAQADALRLLDVSREAVNAALALLWPHLDEFMQERRGPAWKQVFQTIQPILTDKFIRPHEENRPAAKNRKSIKEAITELQQSLEDDDTGFVTMQNVVEQCCNYYFEHDCFPATYEDLQPLPRLRVGLLTFAGDDGGAKGQAHRFSVDQETGSATLLYRFPDEHGRWCWRKTPAVIKLPEIVKQRLKEGSQLAPALREHIHPDGSRIAVLDVVVSVSKASLPPFEQIDRVLGVDWGVRTLLTATTCDSASQQVGRPFFLDTGGFDGRQARTRRQIDELRNQTLAHLAANVLLLCAVHGCSLLSMESLKTLKSIGRGKGVRGRWRNYRNNSTIRGEIWRILRYKCHLAGMRFRSERPKGTSHTCPRCGQPARTYRSPTERAEAVKWGRWLWCENPRCGWNGDRDYAAALNIARLGITFLSHLRRTNKAQAFKMTDPLVKPVSYTGAGAVLLLPPTGPRTRPTSSGKVYYPGWTRSAFLQSSASKETFLRLCG